MKNENEKDMLEQVNPPIDDEPWTEEDEAAWQEGLKTMLKAGFIT